MFFNQKCVHFYNLRGIKSHTQVAYDHRTYLPFAIYTATSNMGYITGKDKKEVTTFLHRSSRDLSF